MRRHSTETLMGLTKRELVEYVRIAEHNQDAAEKTLMQQAENVKDWIPVVRCKDCVYNANGCCTHSEPYDDTKYRPDYFCADGERKHNER